jgi:alkylated DNA repair protein (DNA oxidative demethylase)
MPPEAAAWTLDLFEPPPARRELEPGAVLLGGFALQQAPLLLRTLLEVTAAAPFRHLVTPGGYRMSVAMSNCGGVGWVSDARGYRYDTTDPESGKPWPAMPAVFAALAADAAAQAGYAGFAPDACLINRYEPGARLSLHQDRDEPDRAQPIVSVSLGLPAIFLWGGATREARPRRVPLLHGDVVVWGGPARLHYHGVQPLAAGQHALTGALRYNLTFRRAR